MTLTLFLILARSSKEAFFALFAKNAPRATKACGIVLRLLQNNPASLGPRRKLRDRGFQDLVAGVPAHCNQPNQLGLARCERRFQKAETTLVVRGAFFAKVAKNFSFEERAKVKVKTLGEESPRPSLFFHQ
ncbi:MAG: hypothetical protein H7834_15720 [Magnetococcus sp. YQC-9]